MSDGMMNGTKCLIVNRGEIACRLVRALDEVQVEAVVVHSEDEDNFLARKLAGQRSVKLQGKGAAPFLDVEQLVRVAKETGCRAVHPGYGFLSESAQFAEALEKNGLVFIGAPSKTLTLFGNKVQTREFALQCGVPIIPGRSLTTVEDLSDFFKSLKGEPVMLKASYGGGGRGMRIISHENEIENAFARCQSEAVQAFGNGELFVELFVNEAKHIEIQVLVDRFGNVRTFGERECSVQRQNQKLIEFAPAISLSGKAREQMIAFSETLAKRSGLIGLGTFEFLVKNDNKFYFIECNPRLQVEHTVTEEVFQVDLVRAQVEVAMGGNVNVLNEVYHHPKGFAMQLRINMEVVDTSGRASPSSGTIRHLELPKGRDVRFESAAYVGYEVSPFFDSLLGKLIIHGNDFHQVRAKLIRALRNECFIAGVDTNVSLLLAILDHPQFIHNESLTTQFLSNNVSELVQQGKRIEAELGSTWQDLFQKHQDVSEDTQQLLYGDNFVVSPLHGEVMEVFVQEGMSVKAGQRIAVLNAFKMEHEIESPRTGVVLRVCVSQGQICKHLEPIIEFDPSTIDESENVVAQESYDPQAAHKRKDFMQLLDRRRKLSDDFRKDKIEKRRHKINRQSARENVHAIVDPGSFIEYGSMAIAAQIHRHTPEFLIDTTQGDGVICGVGTVNGDLFERGKTSCAVFTYDYLVLAGTQGLRGHLKKDRIFEVAIANHLPIIILTEGGGGRPGDFASDRGSSGLNVPAFALFAEPTGSVKIGVASGYNFAGNAILLGMCDIIIATKDSNIGVAGPVMVEYAGQGKAVPATALGPASMQFKNGVIHVLVPDEKAATKMAKKCLSYFQGNIQSFSCPDQRLLRTVVPENRYKGYDVYDVLKILCDEDSMMELCGGFGKALVTTLARVEGRVVGIMANQPMHLGGALDAEACEKGTYFCDLCDRFGIPIVHLCDTPGFIVGTEFEKTGLVKYVARFFQRVSQLVVGSMTVVLRKGFGLGAMAMDRGAFQFTSVFSVAWPSATFGGMGLEGAVQLGFKKELQAIADEKERQELFESLVDAAYERGSAFSIANEFAIDEIIDPSETRFWIIRGLDIISHKKTASKL